MAIGLSKVSKYVTWLRAPRLAPTGFKRPWQAGNLPDPANYEIECVCSDQRFHPNKQPTSQNIDTGINSNNELQHQIT
jgi:hypothetical protein